MGAPGVEFSSQLLRSSPALNISSTASSAKVTGEFKITKLNKIENNLTNWVLFTKPNIDKLLVQWCHGAAGIVTAMAMTPKNDSSNSNLLDELLEKTGELVWQAGPLVKGSNICHGTSGNGYAFLYLYKRFKENCKNIRLFKKSLSAS